MTLCKYCIEELRSRGEMVYVGSMECDCDEADELGIGCDWCGEHDDLYDCVMRSGRKGNEETL